VIADDGAGYRARLFGEQGVAGAVDDRDSHPGSGVGPEDTPLVFGSNGPYSAMISKTGAVPAAQ